MLVSVAIIFCTGIGLALRNGHTNIVSSIILVISFIPLLMMLSSFYFPDRESNSLKHTLLILMGFCYFILFFILFASVHLDKISIVTDVEFYHLSILSLTLYVLDFI